MIAYARLAMPRIGVISDTHGLVRPEVRDAFDGVDHILHAGDIGGEEVLAELGTIAEVTGVGREAKVKIDFDDDSIGRKTLVVAQANLESSMD